MTGVKKLTQFAQVTRLDLENLLPEHGLHAPSLQMQTVSIDECVDHHVVDVLPAVTGLVRHLGSGGHGAVDGAAGQDVAQRQVVDVPLGPRRHRPIGASDGTS